jgi:hypothetical protein
MQWQAFHLVRNSEQASHCHVAWSRKQHDLAGRVGVPQVGQCGCQHHHVADRRFLDDTDRSGRTTYVSAAERASYGPEQKDERNADVSV